MRFVLMVVLMISSFSSMALACDPNEDCSRKVGFIVVDDPVCQARKLLCRTQCSKINADADKYILQARTDMANSLKNIETTYYDLLDLRMAASDLMNINDDAYETGSGALEMRQKMEELLTNHTMIDTFITNTKQHDPLLLKSKEGVQKLIEQNENSAPEIVNFLTAYDMLMEQNTVLVTLILETNSKSSIIQMIDFLKKLVDKSDAIMATTSEGIEANWIKIEMKEQKLQEESQNVQNAKQKTQEQEARKCSPLI